MYQQFLVDDTGIKNYRTTNGTNINVKFEQYSNEGGRGIRMKTCGKFKLVMGYYYYKLEEDLNDDEIDDVSYIPESEKINYKGVIFYKVSNYKINVQIIKSRGHDFGIGSEEQIVFDIDILELIEIKIDPIANIIKENMEKNILYVKKLDTLPVIFDNEDTLKNKLGKDWNNKILLNQDPNYKIIKNPLNKLIEINQKKIFITREIDKSFVLVEIKKIGKYIYVYNLNINEFKGHDTIKYRLNEFKKCVPKYKKIMRLIDDLNNESEDSDNQSL